MTISNYSFVQTFNEKARKPDAWDYVGGAATTGDGFFAELGKVARRIKDGTLTSSEAQNVMEYLLSPVEATLQSAARER